MMLRVVRHIDGAEEKVEPTKNCQAIVADVAALATCDDFSRKGADAAKFAGTNSADGLE